MLAHCKYECKYHIVFAPKFRRQIIYGKIKKEVGKILRKLCEYKGIEILEAEACPDQVRESTFLVQRILCKYGRQK